MGKGRKLESPLDFGVGFAAGFAKGGVEMVGGLKDVVVATAKMIHNGQRAIVRAVGWTVRVIWKSATGQSLEMERRQLAAAAAKARKARDKAVKTVEFFGILADEGPDAIEAILTGDYEALNHMSKPMRDLILSSVEIFEQFAMVG